MYKNKLENENGRENGKDLRTRMGVLRTIKDGSVKNKDSRTINMCFVCLRCSLHILLPSRVSSITITRSNILQTRKTRDWVNDPCIDVSVDIINHHKF